MSYINYSTNLKKKFCIHEFRKKYKHKTQEPYLKCQKCDYHKKFKEKNQSIISFLAPAIKPTNPDYVEEHKFFSNWEEIERNGHRLPGTAEPREDCGLWKTKGCRNIKGHAKSSFPGKMYLRQFMWSCFRPACKKCYKKWLGRQANRSTRRIEAYENMFGKKSLHTFISPPEWLYGLPYEKLLKAVHRIRKEIGCTGGALIYHPFRFDKKRREFYYSPHFHMIGFGYNRYLKEVNRNGWFIKNLGRRKSTFHSFHYLLSHCGIKKGKDAITWFGGLSYSKFPSEIYPESNICPLCGRKLVEMYHDGVHPVVPPDEIYEGFVDPEGWYPVETIPEDERYDDRFDYSPFRDLNETIKGIAECV